MVQKNDGDIDCGSVWLGALSPDVGVGFGFGDSIVFSKSCYQDNEMMETYSEFCPSCCNDLIPG